ncbi:hypothetical protein AXG89_07615 [Burkholderia sp. PAMC 26561]|nr:hypothetical protein AXG89_07615 [Burkholderia sp. PAMC 26561]
MAVMATGTGIAVGTTGTVTGTATAVVGANATDTRTTMADAKTGAVNVTESCRSDGKRDSHLSRGSPLDAESLASSERTGDSSAGV